MANALAHFPVCGTPQLVDDRDFMLCQQLYEFFSLLRLIANAGAKGAVVSFGQKPGENGDFDRGTAFSYAQHAL